MSTTIKGYKGFNKDLKCREMQYEIGKEFEAQGEVKACQNGLHFCENPLDVFGYYNPADSRFAEVESRGDTAKENGGDSKVATSKLFISAEISLRGLLDAGVKFILSKVDFTNAKESNTGDQSAATNTGDQSAATNTGYRSAATNTGDQSTATNTGDQSAATNTGYQSAATNTGYRSAATNTGTRSAATNTGDQSAATNTGTRSAATNTGTRSAATNTGDQSAATNTGNRSAATVEGKESVAVNLGIQGKAKGKIGCWIVLAEWVENPNTYEWSRTDVKSFPVDGKEIKEDVFYSLVNGLPTEVD
jgi:hypothetical protein